MVETMRHFYVVSYKKPTSGRLVNIAVSFTDAETQGNDPVMCASRLAAAVAVNRGLPEKRYREYGLSGSLRQCVQLRGDWGVSHLSDGKFMTAETCRAVFGHIPRDFTFIH